MRNPTAILLLMLIEGMSGCGGSNSTPAAPSTPTPPPPAQVQPARFTDPASGFTTSDVRDVQEQIVQFDTTSNSLIWGVDGRRFPGYPVSGNFIGSDKAFQVRFGMKDGQCRAYFTETVPQTICDIEVVGSQLTISPTNVTVAGGC